MNNESAERALLPIKSYLTDKAVVEIMMNPDGVLFVEKAGEPMVSVGNSKLTSQHVDRFLRVCASSNNTELSPERPSLAAKVVVFGKSLRVQGMVPPIVDKPSFAIRKPSEKTFSLDDYKESGTVSQNQYDQLKQAVKKRKNILIGGGTGSGKTTFANAVLNELESSDHRVYIVEDTPEITINVANTVFVRTSINYSANSALKDALRMRPDRIILGELRDSTALTLLKAWNTGHSGGIATLHANNTKATLDRLVSLMEEEVANVDKRLIIEAIDLVAHIERTPTGRKISLIEPLEFKENDWMIENIN